MQIKIIRYHFTLLGKESGQGWVWVGKGTSGSLKSAEGMAAGTECQQNALTLNGIEHPYPQTLLPVELRARMNPVLRQRQSPSLEGWKGRAARPVAQRA